MNGITLNPKSVLEKFDVNPTEGSTNLLTSDRIKVAVDAKYTKPSSGIPSTDLASGVIPTVPSGYNSDPAMNGVASSGASGSWARGDHVHPSDTTKAGKSLSFTVTLSSSSWSSNAQTVTNSNFVVSGYAYVVSPASGSFTNYVNAQIYADDVTVASKMTFHCSTAPTSNITVNVIRTEVS